MTPLMGIGLSLAAQVNATHGKANMHPFIISEIYDAANINISRLLSWKFQRFYGGTAASYNENVLYVFVC
jgi:hypothetical protein